MKKKGTVTSKQLTEFYDSVTKNEEEATFRNVNGDELILTDDKILFIDSSKYKFKPKKVKSECCCKRCARTEIATNGDWKCEKHEKV